jgi:UDP-glucose 4-epimerase
MRVLITGGAGFIGSHLVEHYQHQAEVLVLDNLRTGRRENLQGLKCTLIEGSILDESRLGELMKGVDLVFHLAAMVSVPESMSAPRDCVRMNAEGTLMVLEAATRAKVRKLCFSSTSAIYGDDPEMPKHEAMVPRPISPYAITKLDGEYYCAMFQRQGWLATACMRYFNVFGPRQDPRGAYAAAVPIFIAKALAGEPIRIFGDGEQTRDFVFVKDVVAANAFLADSAHSGVYNVAYGKTVTVNWLAEEIRRRTGTSIAIEHAPERPGDIKHSHASNARLLATGFRPQANLADGLATTVAWFMAQQSATR